MCQTKPNVFFFYTHPWTTQQKMHHTNVVQEVLWPFHILQSLDECTPEEPYFLDAQAEPDTQVASQTTSLFKKNITTKNILFNDFFLKQLTSKSRIFFYDSLKKHSKIGRKSFYLKKYNFYKKLLLGSHIPSLNFSFFFSRQLTSLNRFNKFNNFIVEKRLRSFWPLDYSPYKNMTNYFYRKRDYKRSIIRYKKLKQTLSLNGSDLRGVWSFFRVFKAPRSSFSKVRDFDKGLMSIFWASQLVFKKYFDEKRYWTTRKFFHKFTAWYKRNRLGSSSKRGVEFWQFIISLGLCLSRRTTELSLQSGLLYCSSKLTTTTLLDDLKNSILTVSPQLLFFLKNAFIYRFHFRFKFGRFQHTQYLNRASQWRSLSKKKPKFFFNVFQAFSFNSRLFFFDFFSSSVFFVGAYTPLINTKPHFTSQLPRHNLEKLNTFKLRL